MNITDIKAEMAIVPIEHQFDWRHGLPGSGAGSDTIPTIFYLCLRDDLAVHDTQKKDAIGEVRP